VKSEAIDRIYRDHVNTIAFFDRLASGQPVEGLSDKQQVEALDKLERYQKALEKDVRDFVGLHASDQVFAMWRDYFASLAGKSMPIRATPLKRRP